MVVHVGGRCEEAWGQQQAGVGGGPGRRRQLMRCVRFSFLF